MPVRQGNNITVTRLSNGKFKVVIGDTVLTLDRIEADNLRNRLSIALATDWAMGSEGAKAHEA